MPAFLPAPDVLWPGAAEVGEGPVIDRARGQLLWVDIPRGILYRAPLDALDRAEERSVGMNLGAVAPRDGGGYVVAARDGLGELTWAGDLDLSYPVLPAPDTRMNDAKCDPAGRFWAGATTMEFAPGRGALYCWDPRGGVERCVEGLTLPNGLGWSPDGREFYLADSMQRVLLRSSFDTDSGRLGRLEPLVEFAASEGLPDGLCVDTDGCLWIAMWGAGCVRRHDPSGRLLAQVHVPVSQPSSCALAPDGTLIITSAAEGRDRRDEPHAGAVFGVATPYAAVDIPPFGG